MIQPSLYGLFHIGCPIVYKYTLLRVVTIHYQKYF